MEKESWANFGACFAGTLLLALLAVAGGCSHTQDSGGRGPGLRGVYASKPPSFLTGPASLLLTRASGYSAQVSAQTEAIVERERSASGQLLCLGSKIFFAPDGDAKNARTGGFSFIWDTATQTGYVLSETLQGYAPISANPRATNILTRPSGGTPQGVDGHECAAELDIVQLDNGVNVEFAAWRAADLGGLPLRLNASTNAIPLTVSLTKVRPDALSASLFAPPDGFTKYISPEAMSDEIVARQHNLRRKNTGELERLEPAGTGGMRSY